MPAFTASSFINAPIDRVWAFHEDPSALTRLTPPAQAIRVLSHTGGIAAGARLVISVKLFGPLRVTWRALHTQCAAPTFFVDEQESGPFAYWHHTHSVRSETRLDHTRIGGDPIAGTILRDDVEYEMPFGKLGELAQRLFIARQLRATFDYRRDRTRELLPRAYPNR